MLDSSGSPVGRLHNIMDFVVKDDPHRTCGAGSIWAPVRFVEWIMIGCSFKAEARVLDSSFNELWSLTEDRPT